MLDTIRITGFHVGLVQGITRRLEQDRHVGAATKGTEHGAKVVFA